MPSDSLEALLRHLQTRERHDPHNEDVRLAVRLRARDACEYCLMPTFGKYQVDHIVPARLWASRSIDRISALEPDRHRSGPDHLDNLAWACSFCNLGKGEQITGMSGRRRFRLFDPRRDRWSDHFFYLHRHLLIAGLPGIGKATERALQFNDARPEGPIGTRHEAIVAGRYPPAWARGWTASGRA